MNYRLALMTGLLLMNCTFINSQYNKPITPELKMLDSGYFKWKEFAFNKPWEKVKKTCDIEKIERYMYEYQNYYCGDISDTTKSYLILNKVYHEFNNIWFDQVILHVVGSTRSRFNYSSIYFLRQFSDSIKAKSVYKGMLQAFKVKYGNNATKPLTKFIEKENIDISHDPTANMASPKKITDSTFVFVPYLNENNPFSTVEETEWNGKNNIYMTLYFIKEANLIILSVNEHASKSFNIQARNWYKESEYDEQFTEAFKEFDNRNGYKDLKFGMQKSAVKNIVKFKEADIMKKILVTAPQYKNWFYIPFDFCHIMFNKKNQLYDVTLSKDEYSDNDYEQFLKELIELFGDPTTYKQESERAELTLWNGKNIHFFVVRFKDGSLYADFYCASLDDSSPTDKLY
jgi:hypothetical protein